MSFPTQIIKSSELPSEVKPGQIFKSKNNIATYVDRTIVISRNNIPIGVANNVLKGLNPENITITNCIVIYKLREKYIINIDITEKAFFELKWIEKHNYWQPHGKRTETRTVQKTEVTIDHVLEDCRLGSSFFYREILTTKR